MELTILDAPFGLTEAGEPNAPHPTQARILAWAEQVCAGWRPPGGGIPTLYVQGGWRSGKTTAMLAVLSHLCQDFPGIRVLIARKDFNDLRLSTSVSWNRVRPRELVASEDKQEHTETWHNGSIIFFRELKDMEGLGGQEFGAILVSEPYELEENLLIRLTGRLSQAGMPLMLLLEGNPPNQGHWLHTLVCGNPEKGILPDPSVTFVPLATDENWANLPDSYKQSLTSRPPAWQKKYRLGDWGFTPDGQAVYDLFRESLHVRPVDLVPDRPLIRSWDSGVRHPACLWAQRTIRGQLLIQYEWLGVEIGLGEFARGVKARSAEWYGSRICQDVGDPAMFARAPQTGISDAQMLAKEQGIALTGRVSTYTQRKVVIDTELSRLVDGEPAVLIHPRCVTLIEGLLGGYHYPVRNEGQAFGKRQQEPYKDGWYEHLANAFEYLIINLTLASPGATRAFQQRRALRQRRQLATAGIASF